jgi:hypothetical protein
MKVVSRLPGGRTLHPDNNSIAAVTAAANTGRTL